MLHSFILYIFLLGQNAELQSEVVGIQDGDTITLRLVSNNKKAGRRQGQNLRIRLAHINCPEKGKPYYQEAKKYASDLCFRKNVKIIHNQEFDRYGRLIGEVVLPNGKILNQELVKAGFAVHFKKYSSSITYALLQIKAQKAKLGIWR